MRAPLVVGVDAGATSTRCVVSAVDGTVLGRGRAGGANQNSSGGRPAEALTAALRMALSGLDRAAVVAGVIGAAGAASAGRAEARQAAEDAWRAAGLAGAGPRSVTDLEVAFAAGTGRPAGLLLLSGTGAAAVAFRDGVPSGRCDGYGWLLGDEGSAVWQGREALRAVLRGLDGRGPATLLTGPITEALTGPPPEDPATRHDAAATRHDDPAARHDDPVAGSAEVVFDDPDEHAQALIRVAYRRPPAALGLLAPLVARAARDGDEVAGGIVEAAAVHLLHALDAVSRRGGPPHPAAGPGGASGPAPIVLAGSVLLTGGPVADRVRAGIRDRFGVVPAEAGDGAAGAAVLAIAAFTGEPAGDAVHARLTGTGPGNDFVNI